MERFIQTTLTALLAGAIALAAGCDGSAGDEGDQAADGGAVAGGDGAAQADAPAPEPEGFCAAHGDVATPEGAICYFVDCLTNARYADATAVTDPTSPGFAELGQAIEIMRNLEEKAEEGVEDAGQMRMLFERTFTRGWVGSEVEPVEIGEDRARFTVAQPTRQLILDLNLVDGQWLVLAPEQIVLAPGSVQGPNSGGAGAEGAPPAPGG